MLLLSIHPKYVDAILAGEKSIELRRQRPRISEGPALIYATSPRMELTAFAWIESVTQAPLNLLWQTARDAASVSRSEFNAYFQGLDRGTALHLARIEPLPAAIGLDRLREVWRGFHPPQGFRYLSSSDLALLGLRPRHAEAA